MKTAMQWLDQQIKEKMGLDEHDTNQLKWFIDKALEKEKEQMIEMYYEGHTAPYFSQYGNDVVKQAEDCYNKTYNQNK